MLDFLSYTKLIQKAIKSTEKCLIFVGSLVYEYKSFCSKDNQINYISYFLFIKLTLAISLFIERAKILVLI